MTHPKAADLDLVPRVARLLSDGGRELFDDPALEIAMAALSVIAPEQKWYYLWLLFLTYCADSQEPTVRDLLGPIDDETLVKALVFNHRLNHALAIKLALQNGLSRRPPLDLRLPARVLNIVGTDRWVTAQSLKDELNAIRAAARRLPEARRQRWIEREILHRFKAMNNRVKDAAAMQLMRHAGALNGMQWRRLTKGSRSDAIHIRIHAATAFLESSLRSRSLTARKTRVLPLLFSRALPDEARPAIDSHFASRLLSGLVYETLLAVRSRAPLDQLLPLLQAFYDLLLRELLERPDVARELCAQGPRPTLIITTHGPLAQLPFTALHDGEQYLIERFDVIQAPPLYASGDFEGGDIDYMAMEGGRPLGPAPQIRVLADTKRLLETEREIEAYESLHAKTGADIKPIDSAGEPWTQQTLMDLLVPRGVRILSAHIQAPMDVAGEATCSAPDGRSLKIADALAGGSQADLIVLAGCSSTAQTDWLAQGENSLASLCLRAGAASVISTLWPVSDVAARKFNESLAASLVEGQSRGAAHAAAQRVVMTSSAEPTADNTRHFGPPSSTRNSSARSEAERLDHPYFWAPFMISGAWK